MNPLIAIERWLDIRPGERRAFFLSALGAALMMGFAVTARSLREAFFLDEFDIRQLPYITIATTALSFPAVAAFTRVLDQRGPDRVYQLLLSVLSAGLIALWALTTLTTNTTLVMLTTVGFYLVTAVGTLLLTSGFWVITSERFALRDAKRLFGLISAGGTLGAMVAGLSVGPVTTNFGNGAAVLSLVGIVALIGFLQRFLPQAGPPAAPDEEPLRLRDGLEVVRTNRHLRTMALIVGVATLASYVVDYAFKEAAEQVYVTDEALSGFFGRFYGLTAVISLLLQVTVASRLLARAGVAWSLAVLPLSLILGGGVFLAVPGLLSATLMRGADASLRKSLHRAVLEFLWVPIPPRLRRRTKTFIDSFVDSAAEGFGAVIVFLWATLAGLPSAGLVGMVLAVAFALLVLSRAMGPIYMRSVLDRLAEGRDTIEDEVVQTQFVGGEFTMTVTQLDVGAALEQTGIHAAPRQSPGKPHGNAPGTPEHGSVAARLASSDPGVVTEALEQTANWTLDEVSPLTRLLARDAFYRRAGDVLVGIEGAAGALGDLLMDESADFVVQRRVPRVLATIKEKAARDALLRGLSARRFEVRYRSAVALARRRKSGSDSGVGGAADRIWAAIRAELNRERPIWELQKLLDDRPAEDDFVTGRVQGRGELSLEHTFRLLSLVLDPDPVRTAFHGIVLDDPRLRSLSLEYLEQILPADVRDKLWPFIGDLSEHRQRREIRERSDVVADLLKTGVTLFGTPAERERLRVALQEDSSDDGS
jgi:hypothetical protein